MASGMLHMWHKLVLHGDLSMTMEMPPPLLPCTFMLGGVRHHRLLHRLLD